MIWAAITYSTSEERIKCEVHEAPLDFHKAYGTITSKTNGVVLSLIKGNHQEAAYIPTTDIKLTRVDYRGEF